jgi:hypothetical protein
MAIRRTKKTMKKIKQGNKRKAELSIPLSVYSYYFIFTSLYIFVLLAAVL